VRSVRRRQQVVADLRVVDNRAIGVWETHEQSVTQTSCRCKNQHHSDAAFGVMAAFVNSRQGAAARINLHVWLTYQVSAAPAERSEGGVCCKPELGGVS
jgi:hypothetical protein